MMPSVFSLAIGSLPSERLSLSLCPPSSANSRRLLVSSGLSVVNPCLPQGVLVPLCSTVCSRLSLSLARELFTSLGPSLVSSSSPSISPPWGVPLFAPYLHSLFSLTYSRQFVLCFPVCLFRSFLLFPLFCPLASICLRQFIVAGRYPTIL